MKKTVLVTAAVLACAVMTGAPALAQETGPNSQACGDAKRVVERLEKDLNDAEFNERKREEKKRDDAREARNAARTALEQAKANNPEPRDADDQATVNAAKDLLDLRERELNDAQRDLDRASDKVKGIQSRLDDAREDRDKDCATPVTTTPATPPPAPEPLDLDCVDFPTQAAAQAKLDETPGRDPHFIDSDGDRVACEAGDESFQPPAGNGGDFDQVGEVPSGAIDTGRA